MSLSLPAWLRRHSSRLLLGAVIIASALSFSSCGVDYVWNPMPPSGWTNTFFDRDLNGFWRLVQINSQYVDDYDTNYLYFNGDGRGRYYYYRKGRLFWETTAYWCQASVNGASYYQINLQYESSGSPTTMNYWFTNGGDTLWMQWRNSYGVQTYVYDYQSYAPY